MNTNPFTEIDLRLSNIESLLLDIKHGSLNTPPPPVPPAEKYLTRKETAEKLNVSLPTLGEYTKRNLIKGYRFGVRVLYKQSEVETSLTKMNFGRACHA